MTTVQERFWEKVRQHQLIWGKNNNYASTFGSNYTNLIEYYAPYILYETGPDKIDNFKDRVRFINNKVKERGWSIVNYHKDGEKQKQIGLAVQNLEPYSIDTDNFCFSLHDNGEIAAIRKYNKDGQYENQISLRSRLDVQYLDEIAENAEDFFNLWKNNKDSLEKYQAELMLKTETVLKFIALKIEEKIKTTTKSLEVAYPEFSRDGEEQLTITVKVNDVKIKYFVGTELFDTKVSTRIAKELSDIIQHILAINEYENPNKNKALHPITVAWRESWREWK